MIWQLVNKSAEIQCAEGINLYAELNIGMNKVIEAINMYYGNPLTDDTSYEWFIR